MQRRDVYMHCFRSLHFIQLIACAIRGWHSLSLPQHYTPLPFRRILIYPSIQKAVIELMQMFQSQFGFIEKAVSELARFYGVSIRCLSMSGEGPVGGGGWKPFKVFRCGSRWVSRFVPFLSKWCSDKIYISLLVKDDYKRSFDMPK